MAMGYKTFEICLRSKKGALKDFTFGPNAAGFKVHGKILALAAIKDDLPLIGLDVVSAIHGVLSNPSGLTLATSTFSWKPDEDQGMR